MQKPRAAPVIVTTLDRVLIGLLETAPPPRLIAPSIEDGLAAPLRTDGTERARPPTLLWRSPMPATAGLDPGTHRVGPRHGGAARRGQPSRLSPALAHRRYLGS